MAFETTRQQLLQQAALLDRKYGKSGNQEYRDEAIRLRRIVTELEAFTGGGGSGVTQILAGTNVTVSPAGGTGIVTVNATGGGGGGGDMYKSVYDTDNSGIVDKAEALTTIGRNSTGATLYEGTIVRILGSTGNRPNFVKAQANNDANSAQTFGVVMADMPNNTDGYVLVQGTLHDLDTRTGAGGATNPFTDVTLADGDLLYLHPTIAGYVTNIKPSAPQHLVYVGVVTRTSPTNGTIVYRVQNGYELYELHDVAPTPYINNGVLYRDTTNNLWKSATIATLLGGTPLLSVPTLAQVTTAGNTTTNGIAVGTSVFTYKDTNTGADAPAFFVVSGYSDKFQMVDAGVLSQSWNFIQNNSAGNRIRYAALNAQMTNTTAGGETGILRFFTKPSSSTVTEAFRVESTGNVLINTTTDTGHKLRVQGTVSAVLTNATYTNAVYYNTTTGELTYGTAGGGGGGTPTLAQVTTAGNTTTNAITVGGLVVDTNTLVVDSVNNRVGIGIATPSSLLEVVGNYAGTSDPLIPQLKFQNSNTTSSAHLFAIARVLVGTGYLGGFPEIWIQAYRDASNNGTTSIRTVSNHPLNFWTNDIERLRIFANGNIGINTTTDTGHKLRVQGTVSAALTNATHTNAVYYNTTTGELTYGAAGGGGGGTPTLDQVTTAGNTTTNSITVGGLTVDTNTLYVDSVNNRVGIGTATPGTNGATFEINAPRSSATTNPAQFRVSDGTTGGYFEVSEGASGAAFYSPVFRGSSAGINGLGFVISGMMPSVHDVKVANLAAIILEGAKNNYTPLSNANILAVTNYGTTLLNIAANGNIGINTTTDAGYKLDVNGTARISGTTEIVGASSTTSPILTVTNTSSGNFTFMVNNTGTGNANFGFQINSVNKATIGYHRAGDYLGFFHQTASTNYFLLQLNNDGSFQHNRTSDGSADFKIFSTGNVLIQNGGTFTDAGYRLDVNGTTRLQGLVNGFVSLDTTNKALIVINEGTPTASRGLAVYQNNDGVQAAAAQFFKSRGSYASPTNVNSGDLVGIFTFVPRIGGTYPIDISLFGASMTSSTGVSQFFITGTTAGNYTPTLLIAHNGNVGIGPLGGTAITSLTLPTARLQVRGSGTTTGTTALRIENSSGTAGLIVNDAGNTLLGTTTDTGHKLRVNGTVSAALSNVTHTNQVYYNTATGELTYGALPTTVGYTGIVTIVTNPPGQQNLDFQNGLLVNVF